MHEGITFYFKENRKVIFVGIGVGILRFVVWMLSNILGLFMPGAFFVPFGEFKLVFYYTDLYFLIAFSFLTGYLSYLYFPSWKQNLLFTSLAVILGPVVIAIITIIPLPTSEKWISILVTWSIIYIGLNSVCYFTASFLGVYFAKKPFEVSEIERKILDYIIEHNYKIKVSECAEKLGISSLEVENAIESLSNKRLLKKKI